MPSIADLADGDGPPCTENALLVSLRFVWKEITSKVFWKIIKNYKISHFFCSFLFNPHKTYTKDKLKIIQGLRNPPHIECWNDNVHIIYKKKTLHLKVCTSTWSYKIKLTFMSSCSYFTSLLPAASDVLMCLVVWYLRQCFLSWIFKGSPSDVQ